MIESEDIITITKYLSNADACDEPDLIGAEAARTGAEALVAELIARGYPRPAVIGGLARALSSAVTEALSVPRD